ncbi:predicted protein [Histoplasma mississippiense (nom. inval.)]|uniref:predicted protein n=1 Tax=Ajellomyces capsulatus (strain NAm1 / WU24) TaxID=2059318 RepID=UPI000157BB1D|nr:predicted protein [Histoplasma mississippiense (nom. inval.)]EDN05581.1 predicted protein [Histoplasma mississippiense (nom. inval.)]
MIEREVLIQVKIKSNVRGSVAHQMSPQTSMRGQQTQSARECQDVSTAVNSTQLSISTALLHSDT